MDSSKKGFTPRPRRNSRRRSVLGFGDSSSVGDVSVGSVANRDVNHYHYNTLNEGKELTERREIDFRDAMRIASSFADLLSYFLVARLFELLGVNKRRLQKGENKVSYYALLSIDRKTIRHFTQSILGEAHKDVYIRNATFQLVDVLSAGTESDVAYNRITRDCDVVYDSYVDVQTEDIDIRVMQEQLKNTMLHLFERALRNPKRAIVDSHDFYIYKEKYSL